MNTFYSEFATGRQQEAHIENVTATAVPSVDRLEVLKAMQGVTD